MIRFDLDNIISDSKLSSSFKEICDLSYKLSIMGSEYIGNTKNLTTGLTPLEGATLSKLPVSDPTESSINEIQTNLQNVYDINIPEMYSVNAFQILIASGVLPLGWLIYNKPNATSIYRGLYNSWNAIVLDNFNVADGPLYPHIKSFGLLARMVGGHKNTDLVFFAIYDNQVDYNFLQNYLIKYNISNIVLMDESEYSENLLNGMYYKFLVRFDKVISPYNGVTFKANTKLVESVPTYSLEIGCDTSCVLFREDTSIEPNPRFKTVEFKKGASVTTTIYVPNGYAVTMVVLNGATYFVGTTEMDAAGISILETDITTLTGYRTYNVTVSGLMNNTKVYVKACRDLTGTQVTKNMISNKSSINVTSQDISISLIFNTPFIFFDASKLKVWARKDDEEDEELVTPITILTDGQKYIERKAIFADPYHKPLRNDQLILPPKPRPDIMSGQNPYIYDNRKHHGYMPIPNEPQLAESAILYGVTECGSILLTFDGYSNYKYFRVEFEDRAMVAVFRVVGSYRCIDTIPVINDVTFTNKYYDTIIDDDSLDGVNNDGESDNNTKPDVVLSDYLGLSFDK